MVVMGLWLSKTSPFAPLLLMRIFVPGLIGKEIAN